MRQLRAELTRLSNIVLAVTMMLALLLASSAAAAAPPTSSCAPGACTGTVVRVGPAPLQCERIQQAFNCIPDRTANAPRVHVLVTPGTYPEALRLHASKGPVSLLGLGDPHTVTVAANETCGGSDPTVPCGALQVLADDFVMSNITLANEVEYRVVPAGKPFAIEVAGDRAAVYSSRLLGKDDTVFTGRHRVYFRDTWINGSTDFNFGQGAAVYERCTLMAQPGKYWSWITAHAGNISEGGASVSAVRSAYLILDSRLPSAGPGNRKGTTFLGRPWGPLAKVAYVNTWMDDHIAAAGWTPVRSGSNANVTFREFNSSGPGGSASKRVSWSGQLTAAEVAAEWTVSRVLQGWAPPAEAMYPSD